LQASHEPDEQQQSHTLTACTGIGADHVAALSCATFKHQCF